MCTANQLTGFYKREKLALNGLTTFTLIILGITFLSEGDRTKQFFKISQNTQESNCAGVSFFNKVAGLEPPTHVFL